MRAAIILAGGQGTRLGEQPLPKALLELNGKTLLEWQLDWLRTAFDVIVLALGHKSQEILDHVREKGYDVKASVEKSPLGTAGAVKHAYAQCHEADTAYVVNVDNLARVDLASLPANTPCVIGSKIQYSVLVDGRLRPQHSSHNHIGHTLLSKADIQRLPQTGSLEEWLAAQPKVHLFEHGGIWLGINTAQELKAAEAAWK